MIPRVERRLYDEKALVVRRFLGLRCGARNDEQLANDARAATKENCSEADTRDEVRHSEEPALPPWTGNVVSNHLG